MTGLRLDLLGGFSLAGPGGLAIQVSARKVRALIAYLAVTGRPQGRDRLAVLLWGESPESQARTSLRQALATLRRSLPPDMRDILAADGEGVGLAVARLTLDVAEFERLAGSPLPGDADAAAALYRGELLEGQGVRAPGFDDWLEAERQRLRGLATGALARAMDGAAERGDWDASLACGRRLVALEPFHEDAHRGLMRAHAMAGRRADAIAQFRTLEALLKRELGMAPQSGTQALFHDIQQGRLAQRKTPAVMAPSGQADVPELRHAAVLVAEIDGFAKDAAGLSPEAMAELLNRYFTVVDEAVTAMGGTIATHVADRAMALFGMPATHEDDPERALAAALTIRDGSAGLTAAGRLIALRIGLASGPVLAAEVGSARFRQRTATGEAVNLAWWLAQHAAPGDIVLSEQFRRGLRRPVPLAPCPLEADPPGTDAAVWRVAGASEDGSAAVRPFVGRRLELQQIAGLIEASRDHATGHVVAIRGPAGIGKSRLVEQAIGLARARGFGSNVARVHDLGTASGRHVMRTLVEELLDITPGAAPPLRAAALEQAVREGLVESEHHAMAADLLDLPHRPEHASAPVSEPDIRLAARKAVLASLLARRVAQNPVLLAVEDVHWAEAATLRYLADLAGTMRGRPILLILTTRSEDDPVDGAWRAAAGGIATTTIDLGPLALAEAQAMAAHYPAEDDAFVAACVARADGHPLFLDQLLANADLGTDGLPPSVRSLVLAKLDRLSALDRRAAQAASVLGEQFWTAPLRHLLDDPDYGPERLVPGGLVRPDDKDFAFAHAMMREAIYQSLLPGMRGSLHLKAAEWFRERDLLLEAEHLACAGDPRAGAAFFAAARKQAERHRYRRALQLVERALPLAGAGSPVHDDLVAMRRELGERLPDTTTEA